MHSKHTNANCNIELWCVQPIELALYYRWTLCDFVIIHKSQILNFWHRKSLWTVRNRFQSHNRHYQYAMGLIIVLSHLELTQIRIPCSDWTHHLFKTKTERRLRWAIRLFFHLFLSAIDECLRFKQNLFVIYLKCIGALVMHASIWWLLWYNFNTHACIDNWKRLNPNHDCDAVGERGEGMLCNYNLTVIVMSPGSRLVVVRTPHRYWQPQIGCTRCSWL